MIFSFLLILQLILQIACVVAAIIEYKKFHNRVWACFAWAFSLMVLRRLSALLLSWKVPAFSALIIIDRIFLPLSVTLFLAIGFFLLVKDSEDSAEILNKMEKALSERNNNAQKS